MTVGVLIVDDDAAFRGLARRIVEDAQLVVVGEADTVAAAREAIAELRPAAVLLDVGLPDGDGVTLAAELAELAELPGRPAVLLTSTDPDAVSPADVERSGAVGFVAKADLPNANLDALRVSR